MTNKQYAGFGLMAPIVFGITYLMMAGQRPEYSFMTKAISELGSLDAPHKWIWNVFGYIIPGIFISVFSLGLHKDTAAGRLPLVGIFLSGLFMAIAGIFPGDFDNKASAAMLLHTVGSFGSYLFFLVGAFNYPKAMHQSEYWKTAVKPSLALTWLTIVFGGWPFVFPNMPAVGQRIVFGLYFGWIILNAVKLGARKAAF